VHTWCSARELSSDTKVCSYGHAFIESPLPFHSTKKWMTGRWICGITCSYLFSKYNNLIDRMYYNQEKHSLTNCCVAIKVHIHNIFISLFRTNYFIANNQIYLILFIYSGLKPFFKRISCFKYSIFFNLCFSNLIDFIFWALNPFKDVIQSSK